MSAGGRSRRNETRTTDKESKEEKVRQEEVERRMKSCEKKKDGGKFTMRDKANSLITTQYLPICGVYPHHPFTTWSQSVLHGLGRASRFLLVVFHFQFYICVSTELMFWIGLGTNTLGWA